MTGVLIKRRIWTQISHRKRPHEDEGKDWVDASISQGMPWIGGAPSEVDGERPEADPPSLSLGRTPPHGHSDLRLVPSRTGRQYTSIIQATSFVVFCYGGPSKLKHTGKIVFKLDPFSNST